MAKQVYDVGMVGLGVMGRNLVLNIADHGFAVAGYDTDPAKLDLLSAEAGERNVSGMKTAAEFVAALKAPRSIVVLVPAGAPVDAVIRALLPYLQPGDLLIDGGNSYFKDTELRAKTLGERGVQLLDVGISGGEHGARHGASLMPGGPRPAYERVRPVLEAVAALVDPNIVPPAAPDLAAAPGVASDTASTATIGSAEPAANGMAPDQGDGEATQPSDAAGEVPAGEPEPVDPKCIAYLGPSGAGHFVKMVHNGIEYALMALIGRELRPDGTRASTDRR